MEEERDMVDEEQDPRDESKWPEPEEDEPSEDEIEEWMSDGKCNATDGCVVEPDGMCEHGHPAWALRMGLL